MIKGYMTHPPVVGKYKPDKIDIFYIPTHKESIQLARNNRREDKRAATTFRNNKGNKALSEDYRTGRLGGD